MRVILPTLLSQYDPRWASVFLGNNTALPYNIANDGCDLTDLAMVCRYYGKNVLPSTPDETTSLNDLLKANGGFPPGSGEYVWGTITKIFTDIIENKTDTPNLLTDSQIGEIKTALDQGYPVIVQIDYNPPGSSFASHYVTLVDYNSNDENDFTIADPLGGVNGKSVIHSLKDYLAFWGSARKLINQYIVYQGPVPQAPDANCLLPNTPGNQTIYDDLVHGSSQWDSAIGKYMPGSDPKHTDFPALQATVGGMLSTGTASANALEITKGDLATATANVESLTEQLANEETQRQNDQKMYLSQIQALKASSGSFTQITGSYEGRIAALQGQIKQLLADKQSLSGKLALATASQGKPSFFTLLLRLFNIKK